MHPVEFIIILVIGLPALAFLSFLLDCVFEAKEYNDERDYRD